MHFTAGLDAAETVLARAALAAPQEHDCRHVAHHAAPLSLAPLSWYSSYYHFDIQISTVFNLNGEIGSPMDSPRNMSPSQQFAFVPIKKCAMRKVGMCHFYSEFLFFF